MRERSSVNIYFSFVLGVGWTSIYVPFVVEWGGRCLSRTIIRSMAAESTLKGPVLVSVTML